MRRGLRPTDAAGQVLRRARMILTSDEQQRSAGFQPFGSGAGKVVQRASDLARLILVFLESSVATYRRRVVSQPPRMAGGRPQFESLRHYPPRCIDMLAVSAGTGLIPAGISSSGLSQRASPDARSPQRSSRSMSFAGARRCRIENQAGCPSCRRGARFLSCWRTTRTTLAVPAFTDSVSL
jgi:hypothetical protein